MTQLRIFVSLICVLPFLAGCSLKRSPRVEHGSGDGTLRELASGDRQWTGVAISKIGRTFVTYPRWRSGVMTSVAELMSDGSVRPYPSARWNQSDWRKIPRDRFVAVQSVYADARGSLWILDTGNPEFQGVIPGAPKLVQVDLKQDRVVRVYRFDASAVRKNSYLNDVRIDEKSSVAYLSDSGDGAILVLNLRTGSVRRLLDAHPSTEAEDTDVLIQGSPWRVNGEQFRVHIDGIALNPKGSYLYYQALTGRTLYRVPTDALRNPKIASKDLGKRVEKFISTFPVDGMFFGIDGKLYLSSLEDSSIKRVTPEKTIEVVVQHPELAWPDSFTLTSRGTIAVSTARIHEGDAPHGPYRIFEIIGTNQVQQGNPPPASKSGKSDEATRNPRKKNQT